MATESKDQRSIQIKDGRTYGSVSNAILVLSINIHLPLCEGAIGLSLSPENCAPPIT